MKFEPGDLTPDEEELAEREGLNKLNYIPLRTMARHAEQVRNAIPVRGGTDLTREISARIDGFGYILWLFLIGAFTWAIADAHGWPMGIFSFILMLLVLELSFRLSNH